VFGQHIHIGCASADDAIYLTHALIRYVPHFIALGASSPFYQGVDTAFDSSRLSVVNAFPLSGTIPFVPDWASFNRYFDTMYDFGIVNSMKDFYWDVRPKPEYGTVEIRVVDTPLTVDRAAQIAAYAQALARRLLAERVDWITPELYLVHSYNRFQAARHGLEGVLVNPQTRQTVLLAEDIRETLRALAPHAAALESTVALDALMAMTQSEGNDATWLRKLHADNKTLPDVVRQQAARWMNVP
jgi:carboxylate-amine ligase